MVSVEFLVRSGIHLLWKLETRNWKLNDAARPYCQ